MNVLLNELPEEWNGYKVNTSFRIGVQLSILQYDKTIPGYEKNGLIVSLMFDELNLKDGKEQYDKYGCLKTITRDHPAGKELGECYFWFMNGWVTETGSSNKQRTLDFEKDQWRIYADFRQFYGINLNEVDMHWWEFMGMLWNMPYKTSSFLQVVNIRGKEIKPKMSLGEKESIRKAQAVYSLEQPKEELPPEKQENKDSYWDFMDKAKAKQKIAEDFMR